MCLTPPLLLSSARASEVPIHDRRSVSTLVMQEGIVIYVDISTNPDLSPKESTVSVVGVHEGIIDRPWSPSLHRQY